MIHYHSSAQLANEIELTEDNQLLEFRIQRYFQSEIFTEEKPLIISTPVGLKLGGIE